MSLLRVACIMVALSAPAYAQQQISTSDQIFQQTIGACIGDTVRLAAMVQDLQKKNAELMAKLEQSKQDDASKKPGN